jgi:hypothetical protein
MAIIYKRLAAKGIQDAYEWYEEQLEGLGEDFLEEIDTVIPYLILYPRSFSIRYKNFRVVSLSRFPYLISYHIEKNNIIIHRVSHAHRNKRQKL